MKKLFAITLSVLSFSAFAQAPTGKIVIKKGQHFQVESTSNGDISEEMMGQNMAMKMGSVTKMTADVKDFKDNNYTITQKITNIKSTFNGMGQEKTFDSDKKEDMDGEAGAIYKDKVNVAKDIVVTNDGKTITAKDTTSKPADANPMAAMMAMMSGGQENAAAALFLVIPAGKKIGGNWQDSTISDGLKLVRSYTLNSIANKVASVTINSVLDINKTMQLQGMEMKSVMQSKIASNVLVDLISNIQKENKTTMDVTGTVDVMGQSVPISSKIVTVVTIKEI